MKERKLRPQKNIWGAMESSRIMTAQVHNNVPPGQQTEGQAVG